jgi:hypothetical protein
MPLGKNNGSPTGLPFCFKKLLFIVFSIILNLLTSTSWANDTDNELTIKYSFNHFSYAGPMPVFQLVNDWNGDFKSDDDAISFIQNEISINFNHFIISALTQTYHSFLVDNELASGFYYYNNDITLDDELRIDATMDAKTYSGKGIRLGYEFTSSALTPDLLPSDFEITFTPSLVALRLDDITWGGLEGELFYTSTDDWGGTIDIDYGYTKDHVARRPLTGDYIGQMYSLDLEADIDTPWIDLDYQGINIYGQIHWDDLPRTSAQISTETAFLLFGYEYYEDVVLDPPALHFLQAAIPIYATGAITNKNIYWKTNARFTPVKDFYYHGLEWRQDINWFGENKIFKAGIQYDFSNYTPKISLELSEFSLVFASQTLDVSKSQSLIAKLEFGYSF